MISIKTMFCQKLDLVTMFAVSEVLLPRRRNYNLSSKITIIVGFKPTNHKQAQ